MSSSLITFQGQTIQEPFRRSLSKAVQWFDILQVEVEHRVESILAEAHGCFSEVEKKSNVFPPIQLARGPLTISNSMTWSLTPSHRPHLRVHQFSSSVVLPALEAIPSVAWVATDGNFHPSVAIVMVFYDVACVTERSLQQVRRSLVPYQMNLTVSSTTYLIRTLSLDCASRHQRCMHTGH